MKNSFSKKLLDKPYLLWCALFVVAPLIMVVYYSLTNKSGDFTLSNIFQIPNYTATYLESILYGLGATSICLILAYPFAYYLTKTNLKVQSTMVMLVMLPMWMNFLIRTYSWMTILGETGVLNTFLGKLGVEPLKLLNTPGAVILGMVYNFLPFMILPIYSVLSKMDNSLVEAARDLGANKIQVIKKVIVPVSLPGILSGITMVFVPSVSTFYITQKLGGGKIVLIGDIIELQFQQANNYNLGAALSLVLMVLILICLGVMNYFGADKDGDGGVVI